VRCTQVLRLHARTNWFPEQASRLNVNLSLFWSARRWRIRGRTGDGWFDGKGTVGKPLTTPGRTDRRLECPGGAPSRAGSANDEGGRGGGV